MNGKEAREVGKPVRRPLLCRRLLLYSHKNGDKVNKYIEVESNVLADSNYSGRGCECEQKVRNREKAKMTISCLVGTAG